MYAQKIIQLLKSTYCRIVVKAEHEVGQIPKVTIFEAIFTITAPIDTDQ
jgi:hypothetical protein